MDSPVYVDASFWSLVWPQLEAGAWRYEFHPKKAPLDPAVPTADHTINIYIATDPAGTNTTIATKNPMDIKIPSSSSSSSSRSNSSSSSGSSSNNSSIESGSDHTRRRDQRREPAGTAAGAAAAAAAATETAAAITTTTTTTHATTFPVFFPPAPGVASEALEEAMRRNLPADGSTDDKRIDRLEGVDAVIELLQQVPGYRGTTSVGLTPNMDAIAAAARAALVRTPSPLAPAPSRAPESGADKRTENGATPASPTLAPGKTANLKLGSHAKAVGGDEELRSPFSSCPSREVPAVAAAAAVAPGRDAPTVKRPVGIRGGTRSSTASNDTAPAPSSSSSSSSPSSSSSSSSSPRSSAPCPESSHGSVDGVPTLLSPSSLPFSNGCISTAATTVDACSAGTDPDAVASTRLGRVIKKPVRLEENPGQQTLAVQSVCANTPLKVASRVTATRAEPVSVGVSTRVGAAAESTNAGTNVSDPGRRSGGGGGALPMATERCVARLGTAATVADSRIFCNSRSGPPLLSSSKATDGDDGGALATRHGNGGKEKHSRVVGSRVGNSSSSNADGVSNGDIAHQIDVGGDSKSNNSSSSSYCNGNRSNSSSERTARNRSPNTRGGSPPLSEGPVVIKTTPSLERKKRAAEAGPTSGRGAAVRGVRDGGRHASSVILSVPDRPAVRPVGGLGTNPEETIKEYKRAYDDVMWPALVEEFGWSKAYGPRDTYYMPMGVVRAQNGAKCRVDYYDSSRQVVLHMVKNEARFGGVLERAWAVAVTKPRATGNGSGGGKARRKRRWRDSSRRKSTMMKKEYPKKVSLVGSAYQVDPSNLCAPVKRKEYTPPADVIFDMVWSPDIMLLPTAAGLGGGTPDPGQLVKEFAGVVGHDKCLEILFRCRGSYNEARAVLRNLQRSWRARYPVAASSAKQTAAARATVERETAAVACLVPSSSSCLLPPPPPLPPTTTTTTATATTAMVGMRSRSASNISAAFSSPTTATTVTRSAITASSGWTATRGGGVGYSFSGSRAGCGVGGGGNGFPAASYGNGSSSRRCKTIDLTVDGTVGEAVNPFWFRPLDRSLGGGEGALKRQAEGGVSDRLFGSRRRDKLSSDLNLSRPWSPTEAATFTRALLEEGSKNFYAVQKALPDRQVCELVDRYYGGWKQTEGYKTLKESISRAKLQAICWVCQTGGELICCDGCDAVYHVKCVGLSLVPGGDWYCPACVKGKKNETDRHREGRAASTLASSSVLASRSSSSFVAAAVPHIMLRRHSAAVSANSAACYRGQAVRTIPTRGAPIIAGPEVGAATTRTKRARIVATASGEGTASFVATKRRRNDLGDWNRAGSGNKAGFSRSEIAGGNGSGDGAVHESHRHQRSSGLSARVGASSVRGLERVPIQLGSARVSESSAGADKVLQAAATPPSPPAAVVISTPSRPQPDAAAIGTMQAKPMLRKRETDNTTVMSPALGGGGSKKGTPGRLGAFPSAGVAPALGQTAAPSTVVGSTSTPQASRRGLGNGTATARAVRSGNRLSAAAVVVGGGIMAKVDLASGTPNMDDSEWGCKRCGYNNRREDRRCYLCESLKSSSTRAEIRAPPPTPVVVAENPSPLPVAAPAAAAAAAAAPLIRPAPDTQKPVVLRSRVYAETKSDKAPAKTVFIEKPDPTPPSSLWACRACSTLNKAGRVVCGSCGTLMERRKEDTDDGRLEWWCCSKCSRFNNRQQDGSTCRICSAQADEEEEENEEDGDEEIISVGEEAPLALPSLMAVMTSSAAKRFALPPLPPLPPA